MLLLWKKQVKMSNCDIFQSTLPEFSFCTVILFYHLLRLVLYVQQGLCPGLTHGQKFGISYVASTGTTTPEAESSSEKETTVVQSHSLVLLSDSSANPSNSPNT